MRAVSFCAARVGLRAELGEFGVLRQRRGLVRELLGLDVEGLEPKKLFLFYGSCLHDVLTFTSVECE